MKKDIIKIISLILIWCLLKIIEYYYVIYFLVPLFWVALIITVLILLIVQVVKFIKHKENKIRIINIILLMLFLYLSFNRWTVNRFIEKIDFALLYNKRVEIVEKVKRKELNANLSWNNWICKLPFTFPVVSNSSNEIGIARFDSIHTVTVTFFKNASFIELSMSYKLIYTFIVIKLLIISNLNFIIIKTN